MIFEVHEAFGRELCPSIVGERDSSGQAKVIPQVKVALKRIFAAKDVILFERGQRDVADTIRYCKSRY